MADLSTIINRLQSVDVMELAKQAAVDSKKDYLLLQVSQLEQGQDSQAKPTTLDGNPFYQPSTIYQKQHYGEGLGKVTDVITLYNTGKMHESAEMDVDDEQINVSFNVPYAADVLGRTTDVILGLNDENKEAYINGPFKAAFFNLFEQQTQLEIS